MPHKVVITNVTRPIAPLHCTSLYRLAQLVGVSRQSLAQSAKKHPEVFAKDKKGRYSVSKVSVFLNERGKPALRRRQYTRANNPIALAVKELKTPLTRLSDKEMLTIIERANTFYIESIEGLLKGYKAGLVGKAIKDFKSRFETILEALGDLRRGTL